MQPLTLPEPRFNSRITHLIFDLEHLRDRSLKGSTPKWLFFDLKDVVHQLESLTSARIEGNRTTIMSAVEDIIEGSKPTKEESLLELRNIQRAIKFIEDQANNTRIDRAFICELHKIAVHDLSPPRRGEGSRHPGRYRSDNITINNSEHTPPDYTRVGDLMDELVAFINEPNLSQYDLLKTAVVHHRFAAIHPFDNGNGRTVRLLTYAMLTKQSFIDDKGFRLLNPSAVFCIDRQKYYDMLARADSGGEENMLAWCEYVLEGIKTEIEKIDKLLDVDFARRNIIIPALNIALEKKQMSDKEYEIMLVAMKKWLFQARDLYPLFGTTPSAKTAISRTLQRMKEQNFIMPHPDFKQKYVLRFSNNYLLRGVMQQLDVHNLLPIKPNA
ncbi:MAG: Fic family protein [Candidatus Saccharimonadales bacterium]